MKTNHQVFSILSLFVCVSLLLSCDVARDQDRSNENANNLLAGSESDGDHDIVKMFTGRVVDAEGHGLSGVTIHALATDAFVPVELTTDDEGRFVVTDYGSVLAFRILEYESHGWLYEMTELEASLTSEPAAPRSNRGFSFAGGPSDDGYLPDPRSPAIFVMLKRGEVPAVWPSRGGQDRIGGILRLNGPWRPDFPSMPWIERTDRIEDYRLARSTSDVVDFDFWGLVVDGDGKPVPGAIVGYVVNEAVPVVGAEQLGRGMVRKEFEIRSDEEGRIQIEGKGEYLQFIDIRLEELRWYTSSQDFNDDGSFNQNSIYRFVEGRYKEVYIPDPESPAIFVIGNMVGGIPAAWPSRGGRDRIDGTLYDNEPVEPIRATERWFR